MTDRSTAAGGADAVLPRPLRLAGAPNFRDLGGIAATDGRRIAPRRLFRGEAFAELSARDWAAVRAVGLRLVCDLRSPAERAKADVRWPESVRQLHLAVLPDERAAGAAVFRRIAEDPSGAAARDVLLGNYGSMPATVAGSLRELFTGIIDHDGVPVLIYCREGKDRTGFVTALLLAALGVEWDAIVADYLLSAPHFDADGARRTISRLSGIDEREGPSEAAIEALRVRPEYLRRAFDVIDSDFGGVDEYLHRAGGLDTERRRRLQAVFLD